MSNTVSALEIKLSVTGAGQLILCPCALRPARIFCERKNPKELENRRHFPR
jgi:hypothetical protein